MGRSARLAGWIVFLVFAGLFSAVIGYGVATTKLHSGKLSKVFVEERVIVADAVSEGVRLDLRLQNLKKQPVLKVRASGLAGREPIRLYLTDADDGTAPKPLGPTAKVDRQGRSEARVPLPDQGLRRYRSVTGMQGKRVVFRAPLT